MFVHVYMSILFLRLCLSADLTYYVKEGKSPDTLVGDIAADTHLMESVPPEDHNRITFSQLQRGATGSYLLFRVSKKTGKLYTTQTLDAESMCDHNTECFRIVDVAVQKGTTPIKILEIKVIIQDINDHHPEFPDKQINIRFSEGDVTGTKRLIPNAIDRDVGVGNSQITYELKKNASDPFALFVFKSVDGTSKLGINLEKKLNREVKDSYMIQVIAKDGGSPTKQSVLHIHISVTDVNDNFPRFTKKVYNVSIKNEPSKTSPVVILGANDVDSGKNGKLLYHFSSRTSEIAKTHFEINKVTGEIFLRKKFMFGQDLAYKLYVEAIDGGSPPLSSVAMVLVNVINQQNHAPTIDINFVSTSTENTVGISENIEVGSFIAYVKVTDLDLGDNGEVRCDLHHDKFQLQNLGQKKYQVIVKNSLDREKEDHYDITITCQDEGSPPMRSKSKFKVQVLDVNDVKPQFSKKTFQFWIYENMKSKFPVGYINVTDPDLGPGGKLTYSLLTNNKHFLPFQISDNGLISTVMSLDHEFQDIYKFQVLVKDNGIPSQNNLVNVIVKVKDENDNAPYFVFPSVNPFTLNFVYYPHHTKNITVLRASDSDSRENAFLKYEIRRGNDKQLFTINHYTGLFYFSRQVTKHDAGSYELEFVVKDSGNPVLSATTTIFLALTVSNKTSEMLNALHIQTDDKIHLNFLIIIVSVAVSVSVIVTVSVSICIIRCNDEIGVTHRGEVISSTKRAQKHLMCSSSYLATSCIDVFVARPTDPDKTRTTQLSELSRVSRPGNELDNGHIVTALGIDLQAATDVVYQEIGATSAGKQRDKATLVVPECHRRVSILSSRTDSVEGWNRGDMAHNGDILDQYSSHYSLAHTPWSEHNSFVKPIKQRFSCPVDSRISLQNSYKTNIGQITHTTTTSRWTGLKSVSMDTGTHSLPCNLRDVRTSSTFHPRQLTPLPQIPHPNYHEKVTCSEHSLPVSLPKHYILETNSQNPLCLPHSDYSEYLECSEYSLPLAKYYVLEPDPKPPPQTSQELQHAELFEQSTLTKYYVLEKDS